MCPKFRRWVRRIYEESVPDDIDLTTLYLCCRGRLLAMVRSGVPCEADAEDVLHTAFESFFQKAPGHLSVQEAERYLFRCVCNALAYWWRKSQRSLDAYRDFKNCRAESDMASPGEALVQQEEHAALRKAIAQLPERQQQTISLRYFAGMTTAETAAVMECEPATVRSLLRHGIEKLDSLVGEGSEVSQDERGKTNE